MSNRGVQVLKVALSLSPAERADIADRLLSSLDPPSRERADQLWADEAEDRLDAFERGEIDTFPAGQVFETLHSS